MRKVQFLGAKLVEAGLRNLTKEQQVAIVKATISAMSQAKSDYENHITFLDNAGKKYIAYSNQHKDNLIFTVIMPMLKNSKLFNREVDRIYPIIAGESMLARQKDNEGKTFIDFRRHDQALLQYKQYIVLVEEEGCEAYFTPFKDEMCKVPDFGNKEAYTKVDEDDLLELKDSALEDLPINLVVVGKESKKKQQFQAARKALQESYASAIAEYQKAFEEAKASGEYATKPVKRGGLVDKKLLTKYFSLANDDYRKYLVALDEIEQKYPKN